MVCAFCGSGESNIAQKSVLAEGGLVKMPVCPVDMIFAEESFGRPLTMTQLVNMQKAMVGS